MPMATLPKDLSININIVNKKAVILDLDNTIYLVSSIGDVLFKSLFQLIAESGEFSGSLENVKAEIMRRPFQYVANDYSFSKSLKTRCMELLHNLTYEAPIRAVENYETLREIPCKKFLVTTGFTKMQNSKIDRLGIRNDFEEIYIIDPSVTALSKRDIFKKILVRYELKTDEVLVVGDDYESEIKAAKELGLDSVLYDFNLAESLPEEQKTMRNFKELSLYL